MVLWKMVLWWSVVKVYIVLKYCIMCVWMDYFNNVRIIKVIFIYLWYDNVYICFMCLDIFILLIFFRFVYGLEKEWK